MAMANRPKLSDVDAKALAIIRAEARAKRAYKLKDSLIAQLAKEVEPGHIFEIGKRKFVFKNNWATDEMAAFRNCHFPHYSIELVKG